VRTWVERYARKSEGQKIADHELHQVRKGHGAQCRCPMLPDPSSLTRKTERNGCRRTSGPADEHQGGVITAAHAQIDCVSVPAAFADRTITSKLPALCCVQVIKPVAESMSMSKGETRRVNSGAGLPVAWTWSMGVEGFAHLQGMDDQGVMLPAPLLRAPPVY
jgi:hypothetical protein